MGTQTIYECNCRADNDNVIVRKCRKKSCRNEIGKSYNGNKYCDIPTVILFISIVILIVKLTLN